MKEMKGTDKKLTIVIPQWQGGGQDLCTYYGAFAFHENYLQGAADVTIEVSTEDIGPVREGILGYDDILESTKRVNRELEAFAPEKIFTVGGGCDADTPCAAWLNRVYGGDMAVVYIDSHGDLNTPASSESHLYYGMSLRALAGESAPEYLENLASAITPAQLITCGARNLDPAELQYKTEHQVADFTVAELEADPGLAAAAIASKGFHNVYIHIDLDVLDPSEFQLTPLEEPDGMTRATLLEVLRQIRSAANVVGFGLLEYSGGPDDRDDPFLEAIAAFGLGILREDAVKNEHLLYFDNHYTAPVMVRGEGPYLYDEEGRTYLETCGGSISNSLAYGREDMAEVLGDQARALPFAYFAHVDAGIRHEAAETMAKAFPAFDRFFFCSGGSEATEIATKIARLHFYHSGRREKKKIIGRWMSYHGYTEGALSYGGHPSRRKEFVEILREDGHIPPAYCYRCWYGKSCETCNMECAYALEEAIRKAGPETVAAFIAEPVVGTALCGVPAPEGYFRIIREICDKYDVLMITDEVMCGTGRTGTMSCIEQYGVEPDIIALAKSLGGSYFPVGAVGMKENVAEPIMDNGIFPVLHTWTASPMACAVIKKTLEIIQAEDLLANVRKVGAYFMDQLRSLQERNPYIGDVRGKGLMIGLEFVRDKATKEPFPPEMKLGEKLYQKGIENGLILMECMGIDHGEQGDALLFGPCFEFTEEHVDETIRLLEKTIDDVI